MLHSRVCSWAYPGLRLKKLYRDKHSSLFENYGGKKFYNIGPRLEEDKDPSPMVIHQNRCVQQGPNDTMTILIKTLPITTLLITLIYMQFMYFYLLL